MNVIGCLPRPRLIIIFTTWLMSLSYQQDKKVYVQHLMEQEALKLWELLEKGAHVYVCGYVNSRSILIVLCETFLHPNILLSSFSHHAIDTGGVLRLC